MKVNKNWCEKCQVNFLIESMFFAHIVGDTWPDDPKTTGIPIPANSFHRRHLTEAELHEKGWTCQELLVDEYLNGDRVQVPRLTWVMPGQLEAREKWVERLKTVRSKGIESQKNS
jgi:hypothetical protein